MYTCILLLHLASYTCVYFYNYGCMHIATVIQYEKPICINYINCYTLNSYARAVD